MSIVTLGLLHGFEQKWLVWEFELKRVGDYGLVYTITGILIT